MVPCYHSVKYRASGRVFISWGRDCISLSQITANHLTIAQPSISLRVPDLHYIDVIMDSIASQITSLTIVYSAVYSGADQRKHQSSVSLAFVRGIHRGPVNSPHKWPVTRNMFPFDDVIMFKWVQRLDYSSPSTGCPGAMPHWLALGIIALDNVFPDSKVYGANMGPTWGRQDTGGPLVGPMNIAIWVAAYTALRHYMTDIIICSAIQWRSKGTISNFRYFHFKHPLEDQLKKIRR